MKHNRKQNIKNDKNKSEHKMSNVKTGFIWLRICWKVRENCCT